MNALAKPTHRRGPWLPALVLVLAVALLYGRTYGNGFVSYDDGSYLTENPHVRGGLTAANAQWAFTHFHSGNWHPLTWLSHQLDVSLFGLAPGAHHLVGAALHALNAVLLFVFLARVTAATAAAFLCALLFAVHPLRVESVAWASERKDLLAGAFFFLTLLAWERSLRRPGGFHRALAVACCALGLLAKPMLVTLPLLLLVLDRWPLERRDRPLLARVRDTLPLFALAGASAVVTVLAQRAGDAVRSLELLPLGTRLATAILGSSTYLAQSFWPRGLAFFYPHPALVDPAHWNPLGARVALGAGLLAALLVLGWRLRSRAPAVLAGMLWMGVMLLPVIGLVQVGAQLHADRYTYLPMIGPLVALVYGIRALAPARVARVLYAAGMLAAGVLGALTWRQVETWKDTRSLCEHALAVTEHNDVARQHLALALLEAGELERARQELEALVARAPANPEHRNNLGFVRYRLGQLDAARADFEEVLRTRPDFLQARLNLGLVLEAEGRFAEALATYARVTESHPEDPTAWWKRGDAALALERPDEARTAYARALALDPTSLAALCGLADALARTGDGGTALTRYESALELAPDDPRALLGAAWVRATARDPRVRDPRRALELVARARARENGSWRLLRVEAAALAASGRHAEAALTAARASALAPRSEWERLAAERGEYAAGRALER